MCAGSQKLKRKISRDSARNMVNRRLSVVTATVRVFPVSNFPFARQNVLSKPARLFCKHDIYEREYQYIDKS